MSIYFSKSLATLKPYVPGEQPQGRKFIKLNTNESPYPPSPAVINAVNQKEVTDLRLYSDPDLKALVNAIADNYAVPAECVFCGNGSDEVLSFAFLAWGKDIGVAYPDISYGFYHVFDSLYELDSSVVPLEEDLSLDISKFYGNGRMTVFANPNAPTGLCVSVDEIKSLAKANKDNVVIVDEAYVDFGSESALPLIFELDNVLVVRTFSKSRQLAGGRLGYAFGNPELINDLNRVKFSFNPYNVNRLTSVAGIAAINDDQYFNLCVNKIISTRTRLMEELQKLGFFVTDSHANFIFASHHDISGKDYYEKLREKGILVRHFSVPRIENYVRITIGSDIETDALIASTKAILQEVNSK